MSRISLANATIVGACLWAAGGWAAETGKEAMVMPCDTGGDRHLTQRAEPACAGQDCRVELARYDAKPAAEKPALRSICVDDCKD